MEPWNKPQTNSNNHRWCPRVCWGGEEADFGSGNILLASQVEFHCHCQEKKWDPNGKKPQTPNPQIPKNPTIMRRVGQQDLHQKMTLENTASFCLVKIQTSLN